MQPMQQMSQLDDIYKCAICFEPMKTAVSLIPCGHELDEGCARGILEMNDKKCPVCRVDVKSFMPAYTTRQAIEKLEQIMQNSCSPVTIHVKRLTGYNLTLKIERSCKVAKLFPQLCEKLGFSHPRSIQLRANGQIISPFKYLNEYISNDKSEFTFFATEYLGHWTTKAQDHRLIFERALAEVGKGPDLAGRFLDLYDEAISEALK